MTSSLQTTDLATEATAPIADADNNDALVSSLADTDFNGLAQAEPGTQSKYPTWLLELTHQLRNFRQWRLIIARPDTRHSISTTWQYSPSRRNEGSPVHSPTPAQPLCA